MIVCTHCDVHNSPYYNVTVSINVAHLREKRHYPRSLVATKNHRPGTDGAGTLVCGDSRVKSGTLTPTLVDIPGLTKWPLQICHFAKLQLSVTERG